MLNTGLSYLHDLTDNELVELAQTGDDNAYSVLVGRYIFLVRNCAAGYFSDSLEFEDLMQEGYIGLINAVKSFDSSCSASFSTFAHLCVDRNIISAVRRSFRKKQIPKSMLVFIDDGETVANEMPSEDGNPEADVIAKEDLNRLKKNIFSKLSGTELHVLQEYLAGKSYEQIASELAIPVKSVDNALQRLRAKLK